MVATLILDSLGTNRCWPRRMRHPQPRRGRRHLNWCPLPAHSMFDKMSMRARRSEGREKKNQDSKSFAKRKTMEEKSGQSGDGLASVNEETPEATFILLLQRVGLFWYCDG
uniref:Uncharacterized protein n=1 Tax=Oryza nivara TaxID=4536 RepID=A0A0E0HFP5_ORYNI